MSETKWMPDGVSPLTITIMFECYATSKPGVNIPEQIWNSEAAKCARALLASYDLIDASTDRSTERGDAWVKFICETPLPVKQWVLPSALAKARGEA